MASLVAVVPKDSLEVLGDLAHLDRRDSEEAP